jgi:hydroxymethylpyrimidine pyrophosphatase-like HAD family hydrolase
MTRVLAFDYDGTIAVEGIVAEPMRAALLAARQAGLPLIVATGRRFQDLLAVCPDVFSLFDRAVAENGAVLAHAGGQPVPLADPIDLALEQELTRRAVPVLRGQVLLALEPRHLELVEALVAQLALEVRVVKNRDSLVVVPASVSKASGVSHALASLGVTLGDAIAFGDGENDVPLLSACALGVAVGDAVAELKVVADVVLARPGPECLAEFVIGLAQTSRSRIDGPEPDEGALV